MSQPLAPFLKGCGGHCSRTDFMTCVWYSPPLREMDVRFKCGCHYLFVHVERHHHLDFLSMFGIKSAATYLFDEPFDWFRHAAESVFSPRQGLKMMERWMLACEDPAPYNLS